jgi:hypothetical protein
MNWIKPKTKKPIHYMDRIRKSLGLEQARSTILGESSLRHSSQEPQETKADILVLSSPMEDHNPVLEDLDEWEGALDSEKKPDKTFKPDPASRIEMESRSQISNVTTNSAGMTKWDLKLQRIFSKQKNRVQPKQNSIASSFVEKPNFVSIFDQVSEQFSQNSHNQAPKEVNDENGELASTSGRFPDGKSPIGGTDQRVPVGTLHEKSQDVVRDSQSEHGVSDSHSIHSRLSSVRKRKAGKVIPETLVNSPEFHSGQFFESMRPSNSIDLIPQTPILARVKTQPPTKANSKPKGPEVVPIISLRYSSSSEDRVTPIRCSNRQKYLSPSPKKKLRTFRDEIHLYLDEKCKEMKDHIDEMIESWEGDLKSPDCEDYVGLFTPGCGDPFDD